MQAAICSKNPMGSLLSYSWTIYNSLPLSFWYLGLDKCAPVLMSTFFFVASAPSFFHEKIFTPICPTAKCPHDEKYAEMSHGEKVVRRNVPRRNVLTANCPYGEMSHGELSHGEKSHGEMSGHGDTKWNS